MVYGCAINIVHQLAEKPISVHEMKMSKLESLATKPKIDKLLAKDSIIEW